MIFRVERGLLLVDPEGFIDIKQPKFPSADILNENSSLLFAFMLICVNKLCHFSTSGFIQKVFVTMLNYPLIPCMFFGIVGLSFREL